MYFPNKRSPRWHCTRHQDLYTNLGFDYHGRVYEKTVSPVILKNRNNKAILSHIEPIITYLIDAVKQIKLQYMFSLDKNDTRVN
jgi:hypothetical protein